MRPIKTGGYSLVEVLIAITILLLAIAGPLTIASKGLQASYFARDQLQAFMLAQESIELIIALRNEEVITQLNQVTPDLSRGSLWEWTKDTGDNRISTCFIENNKNGCDIRIDGSTDYQSLQNNFTECTGDTCRLSYDDNWDRTKYRWYPGGTDTQFTRVVKLERRDGNGPDSEVDIVSTVSWEPTVFGGSTAKTIELKSTIMNLYATP